MRKALVNLCFLPMVLWSQMNLANTLSKIEFVNTPNVSISSFSPLRTIKLVDIISEPQDGLIHTLLVQTDDYGDIVNLIRKTENSSNQQVISMEQLMREPVVLAHAEGRDILLLKCEDCTPSEGGAIELEYLYNGMTMRYKDLEMNINPYNAGYNSWQLYDEDNEVLIETLRMIPRKIFGQLVGIKKILINE